MTEQITGIGLSQAIEGVQKFLLDKPRITQPDQVLVKIISNGICGTDLSMIKFHSVDPVPGDNRIVMGHEGFGVVAEVGSQVKHLKPGDYVVPIVRHGCGGCGPCFERFSDMCPDENYTERGLHKLNGFLMEYIVDTEEFLVKVPANLTQVAVLAEPMSIVEKAFTEVTKIQQRLPCICNKEDTHGVPEEWRFCKKALVFGTGPIGFLAALLLRLNNLETYFIGRRGLDNYRIKLFIEIGAKYINLKELNPDREIHESVKEITGPLDLIFEATAISQTTFNIIRALGKNGIAVLTGIPRESNFASIDTNLLLRQIVRFNQVIVGTVNSNRTHFEKSLADMDRINQKFGDILSRAITRRYHVDQFQEAFERKDPDDLKTVINFIH